MRTSRIALSVTMAITATAIGASPASAGLGNGNAEGFELDTLYFGFFYDDPGQGVVVTAGPPIEDWCLQASPGTADLRVFLDDDGTATLKAHGVRDVTTYVYRFGGTAPELVGMACEAIFDGDPATDVPEPWAVGTGLLKFTVTGIGDDDGFDISNSINGVATATDGTHHKVRGWADYAIDGDGMPVGDPAEFQGASVREIRRGR